MSTLTFTIPPESWLTSNRHGIHRGQRARIVRELHGVAIIAAKCADLEPITGPVAAHWVVRYPKGVSWKHGDAANAQPTTKALLDALVPRWIPGDGPLHVTSETFKRGPNLDRPRDHEIALTLTSQGAHLEAMAEAWDDGYTRGVVDNTSDLDPADNPYRSGEQA